MSIRDEIFAITDDRKSEVVVVPEWNDMKFTVRELSAKDRNVYLQGGTERVETVSGYEFIPVQDPLRQAHLVILSTFDEDGTRVFDDGDEEQLSQKGAVALDRLAKVAVKLSGLAADTEDEAGKASEATTDSSSSSS